MSRIVLEVIAIILIIYLASGAWAAAARRSTLTERDYRKARQWRMECLARAPGEDPLLRSLDRALLDDQEAPPGEGSETLLPSDDQKG